VRVVFPGADVEGELPVTLQDVLRGGRRRISVDRGRSLDVEIPAGVRDGTVLRLAGQGQHGAGGGQPGDLFLRVRLLPDPRYRVAGDDLEMDLPLSPWQAVLGDEVNAETPDGPVTLRVPAGTQSGRRLRLRARGLPRPGGQRGDLHAVARIRVPERPSDAERAAYEALRGAATGESARASGGR
jgi:curved DNA-binding protein